MTNVSGQDEKRLRSRESRNHRQEERQRHGKRKGRGSDGQMGQEGGSFDNRASKHPLIPNHVSLVFQRVAVTLRTLVLSVYGDPTFSLFGPRCVSVSL